MKLTKKQLSTMALIKRSCQHPDRTYSVSKTVHPLIDDMPIALIERDFQPGSGGRLLKGRVSPESIIWAKGVIDKIEQE